MGEPATNPHAQAAVDLLRRRQAPIDQELGKLKREWDEIEGDVAKIYLEMRDEWAPAGRSKP